MELKEKIRKIRKQMNMSQEEFAQTLKVSRQAVQKWENGTSYPELPKLAEIAKRFDISLDALVLDRDLRMVEGMGQNGIMPNYAAMHDWELYVSAILCEYQQCVEEGLDIGQYKNVIFDIAKLPKDDRKKKFGDVVYDIVVNAKIRDDYPYMEPSELEDIKDLRKPYKRFSQVDMQTYQDKVHGAWLGRICGCMLGKPVECIRTNELIPLLQETENYPLHRYVLRKDIDGIDVSKYQFPLASKDYADEIDGMPVDDDTNYVVLAQKIIEDYGREFAPKDVAQAWLRYQPKDAYCTAERVAFCNFVKGYEPPYSAIYQNPYREWIGAQIRTDYYGYINPGNPELAAEMAWRDASVSHVKNGIYGAMFAAAMISVAAVTNDVLDIVLAGLAEIPHTSRFFEAVMKVAEVYKNGVSAKECFCMIHEMYDEYTDHGWCHTIPNAMIVAASLLYGNCDYGKSICMAVETGFDTDCNGATVGSVLGMANGRKSIPEYWTKPIQDTLHTSIFGMDTVKISDMAAKTMEHVR